MCYNKERKSAPETETIMNKTQLIELAIPKLLEKRVSAVRFDLLNGTLFITEKKNQFQTTFYDTSKIPPKNPYNTCVMYGWSNTTFIK